MKIHIHTCTSVFAFCIHIHVHGHKHSHGHIYVNTKHIPAHRYIHIQVYVHTHVWTQMQIYDIRIHTLTCAGSWWCVVCVYEPQPHSTRAGAHTPNTHTQHTRTINNTHAWSTHKHTCMHAHSHTQPSQRNTPADNCHITTPTTQHNIPSSLRIYTQTHTHTYIHTHLTP